MKRHSSLLLFFVFTATAAAAQNNPFCAPMHTGHKRHRPHRRSC